ncbi:MAG TPA: hypothetical protein VGB53_00835 [Rubricoccaceae bacterium]
MPLVREVQYVVDDSQLKASDAEIARSQARINDLLRERESIASRRNDGTDKTLAESQQLVRAYVDVNSALQAARGTLTEAESDQAKYAAGIERTSALLRDFAGITYDGKFWRDVNDGLMSPGEVAAVVGQYKDMEKVLANIAGIKFDGERFVDRAGLAVSPEEVQGAKDMIAGLSDTDRATQSATQLGTAFNVLRSQILPTSQTANGFTNLLELLVDRQMSTAAASRTQASAAAASGSAMQGASASALALRAALGGIILQALITFITLGIGALNKLGDAQRAATQAAREHRNEIDELIVSVRRLAAEQAYSGRQQLNQAIGEQGQVRSTTNAALGSLGFAEDASTPFIQRVTFGINRTLVDRLVALQAITEEQAAILSSGEATQGQFNEIRAAIRTVRDQASQSVIRLGTEAGRLDQDNADNPYYQLGAATDRSRALVARGVTDSPVLRALNLRIQELERQIEGASEVGQVDYSQIARDERAAERARLQAERDALREQKREAKDALEAAQERLDQATENADARSGIEVSAKTDRVELARFQAQQREDAIRGAQEQANAEIALIDNVGARYELQRGTDARFQEQLHSSRLRAIEEEYNAVVGVADAQLAAERARAPTAYSNPQDRANADAVAVQAREDAVTTALRAAELARSKLRLEGTAFRIAQDKAERDERVRIQREGNERIAEQTADYLKSERGLMDQAAVQESLLNEGRITSQNLVAQGLRDLGNALDAATSDEKRAKIQALIDRFKRLGDQIEETTEQAVRSNTDKTIAGLDRAVKLANELGEALQAAGQDFLGELASGIGSITGSIRGAIATAQSVRRNEPGFTGAAGTMAQIGAYAGAAGAVIGAVSGIVGFFQARAEAEREEARIRREQTKAIEQNTRALLEGGQVGADLTAPGAAAASAFIGQTRRTSALDGFGGLPSADLNWVRDFMRTLDAVEAAGGRVDDIREAIASGNFEEAYQGFVTRFTAVTDQFGTYGTSLQGAMSQFETFVRLTGTEGTAAIREWTRLLLASTADLGGLSDLVRNAATLTPEQRQAEIARILALVTNDVEGDFDFGTMTPAQVLAILTQVRSFGGAASGGSLQAGAVSNITAESGSVLIGLGQESLRTQRDMRDLLGTLVRMSSGSPAGVATTAQGSGATPEGGLHVGPVTIVAAPRESDEELALRVGREVVRQARQTKVQGMGTVAQPGF